MSTGRLRDDARAEGVSDLQFIGGAAAGPRAVSRRALAGLPYDEQVQIVRPVGCLPHLGTNAVQFHEESSGADDVAAYVDAQAYVTDFYDAMREVVQQRYQIDQQAVARFREYTEIEDATSLDEALVEALLDNVFKLLGGYKAIKRGLAGGYFAAQPARIRNLIERGVDVSERALDFGDAGRGAASSGSSHHRARDVADFATDEATASLIDWSAATASLQRERSEMRGLVRNLRGSEAVSDLHAEVSSALGSLPEVLGEAELVAAIDSLEIELYRSYYRGSGARFAISSRASRRMSRGQISGGGWRDAVGERIIELRSDVSSESDVANFLGLPVVIVEVETHNPEGFSTPGGPRQ